MKILSSRYDRNAKLYEKVKNNDYDDYNASVVDQPLDFKASVPRAEFLEQRRLKKYFNDIDDSITDVTQKLDTMKKQDTLEIKKDVDLQALIASAKLKQMQSGGQFFSNTQHEILNSLNVEEEEVSLENIVGEETDELENTTVLERGFDSDVVSDEYTSSINFNELDKEGDSEFEKSSVFVNAMDVEKVEDAEELENFEESVELKLTNDYEESEGLSNMTDNKENMYDDELEIDMDESEVEEEYEDFDFDEDDEIDFDEDEDSDIETAPKRKKDVFASGITTAILIVLILVAISLGVFIVSKYLEVF